MKSMPRVKLFTVMTCFLYGNSLLLKMIYGGGKSFVLSLLIAAVLAFLTFTAVMLPFLKYPYITSGEYITLKAGKKWTMVLNGLFVLCASVSVLTVYAEYIRFLSTVSLNVTPNYFIAASVAVFVLAVSCVGLGGIAGFTACFFPVIAAFVIVMLINGAGEFRAENIFPLYDDNARDILISALKIWVFLLSDLLLAVSIAGREVSGTSLYRTSLVSLAVWLVTMILFGYLPIAVFGENFSLFRYPMFQTLATFERISFMPKCAFGFTVLSFFILIIKSAVTVCFMGNMLSDIFGKPKNKLVFVLYRAVPVAVISAVASRLLTGGFNAETPVRIIFALLSGMLFTVFVVLYPMKIKKRRK